MTWNQIAGQWPWETPRDWEGARASRAYVHRAWGWGSTSMLDRYPESLREPAADAPRENEGLEWAPYLPVARLYDSSDWDRPVNAPTLSTSIPIRLTDPGFEEPDTRTYWEKEAEYSAENMRAFTRYISLLFIHGDMPVYLL